MNFDEFCVTYNTDKSSKSHNFCEFYDKNLNLKNVKSLLEIGVKHGASLKSWAGYIPDAAIHGMDFNKKIAYQCRLLENVNNVKSHAVLYDIEQRYFVFKKNDVIPPLMCRVCFNKASESARIYCSNGHWFCLECCKNLLRMAKVCPICREPSYTLLMRTCGAF